MKNVLYKCKNHGIQELEEVEIDTKDYNLLFKLKCGCTQILDIPLKNFTDKKMLPIKNWKTPCSKIQEQSFGRFHVKKRMQPSNGTSKINSMGYHLAAYSENTEITILREGEEDDIKDIWMSDSPNEYYAMCDIVSRIKPPNVLIGGLGLGLLIQLCLLRNDIKKITVVEKSPEVIHIIKPYINSPKVDIFNEDFIDYLSKKPEQHFTTIIADIWKGPIDDKESYDTAAKCLEEMIKNYPDSCYLFWLFQQDIDEYYISNNFNWKKI